MSNLEIITDKPIAYDSPDHIQPWGTARDNSTNEEFNRKLTWWLPNSQLRVLDIGCSGGGFVKSILDGGAFAVGVEGSDLSKRTKRAEWATIPGNLFTADATVPFQLVERHSNGERSPLVFNVITAWEFIEHIHERDLPAVFQNMSRHLEQNGVIILSISPNSDVINGVQLHQTIQGVPWWINKLTELGFENHPRAVEFFAEHFVRGGGNAPNSFHVVLTRVGESLPFQERVSTLSYACFYEKEGFGITDNFLRADYFRNAPLRVVDVGARGGFEPHWDVYRGQIELIGFDPDRKECERRGTAPHAFGRKETLFPVALYSGRTKKTLFETINPGASSFLVPNTPFIQRFPQGRLGGVAGESVVETIDLDSFLAEQKIEYVDFIKFAVEGAELEVLKGAEETLRNSVVGVSIEIFFQPYRLESPTFGQIDDYLRNLGFALFDLRSEKWRRNSLVSHDPSTWYHSGQIMLGQAIYFKDLVPGFPKSPNKMSDADQLQAMKLASFAEVFGMRDFSVEILNCIMEPG